MSGQCVAAGSRADRKDGRPGAWTIEDASPPVKAPSWLLDMIKGGGKATIKDKRRDYGNPLSWDQQQAERLVDFADRGTILKDYEGPFVEGERDRLIFQLFAEAKNRMIHPDTMLSVVLETGIAGGLDDETVQRKMESVYHDGNTRDGYGSKLFAYWLPNHVFQVHIDGKPQGYRKADPVAWKAENRDRLSKSFPGDDKRAGQMPGRVENGAINADETSIAATPFVLRAPAAIPPREWVYGHHLIRKYVSLTVAPGATGKSSLLIADALAMVTGRNLLNTSVYGGPLRVWLWNLEDPRDELERRIAATAQHYGISADDIGGRLFVDSGREQGLCIAQQELRGARILEPVADALEAEIRARGIDTLIVDPFVSSHSVSENDNGAIDAVAKRWGIIADRTNCAIELVHHLRKLGGGEATAEAARGAIALIAAARSVRVLNRMTQAEAEKAGLDGPNGYFRVGHDKENLAPAANKADWFGIESVALANGDNVGVVVPWQWPDAFGELTAADLLAVQKAIHGKGYRASPQAEGWVGNAIAQVLGFDTTDKAAKARITSMVKTWIANGALTKTNILDVQRRKRPVIEVGKWVEG